MTNVTVLFFKKLFLITVLSNELERSVKGLSTFIWENFSYKTFKTSAKNIVPRTGVEPVNPLRDTAF